MAKSAATKDVFDFRRETIEEIERQRKGFPETPEGQTDISDKERALVLKCWEMHDECRKGRNKVESHATEHLQRLQGKYSIPQSGTWKWAQCKLNLSQVVVLLNAALEADTELQISVRPKSDVTKELHAIVCEYLLREIDGRPETEMTKYTACIQALTMGTRILTPEWEEDEQTKTGTIHIRAIDPRLVMANPDAVDRKTTRYLSILTEMSLADIKKRFKTEGAKKVSVDQTADSVPTRQRAYDTIFVLYMYYEDDSTVKDTVPVLPDPKENHGLVATTENNELRASGAVPVVTKKQDQGAHLREHEPTLQSMVSLYEKAQEAVANGMEEAIPPEVKAITPDMIQVLAAHVEEHRALRDNPPAETRETPLYPNARCTVVTTTRVLYDSINPYPEIPPVLIPNEIDPGCLFGISEIRNITGLEDAANRLVDKANDVIRQQACVLLTPKGETESITAGVTFQQLTTDRKDDYGYIQPPQLGADLKYMSDFIMQLHEMATGQFESLMGKRPKGIIAGTAIQQLNVAGTRRSDLRVKYLKQGYQQLYELVLKIVLERYKGAQILRIVGERGKELADKIAQLKAANKYDERTAPIRHLAQLRNDMHYFEVYADRLDGEYDVQIDIGVDTTRTNAENAELSLKLFEMRAIDDKALLDAVKWADRDAVLERTSVLKQLQAENEQLKQAVGEMQKTLQKLMPPAPGPAEQRQPPPAQAA